MLELTLKTIARWCGGDLHGEDVYVRSISTDTRAIDNGALFIALKGERFNAHDFIDKAAKAGAYAVVCEKVPDAAIPYILVEDSLTALGQIARGYRDLIDPKVIAVTGSVGKTTTKDMIACALSGCYTVQKTEGNYNNEIGLPLTIFGLEPGCEIAVYELGMNHFGEMSRLSHIAAPNIVVITNIGTMHIEYLGSREGILKAKLEILDGLKPGGNIILNGDEPLLWSLSDELTARNNKRPIYYSIHNSQCDIRASDVRNIVNGMDFTVTCNNNESVKTIIPVLGEHNVYNAIAAIAAAKVSGVSAAEAAEGLSQYKSSEMRQNIEEISGITIIKDYYNAGPESMKAALSVLEEMPVKGKRFAVLGSMLELGEHSEPEHRKLGELLSRKVDILYGYGDVVKYTVEAARKNGLTEAKHFESKEELADKLIKNAQQGDAILIKGSRGMRMEEVCDLFIKAIQ